MPRPAIRFAFLDVRSGDGELGVAQICFRDGCCGVKKSVSRDHEFEVGCGGEEKNDKPAAISCADCAVIMQRSGVVGSAARLYVQKAFDR